MKASVSISIEFRELPMEKERAAEIIMRTLQQLAGGVNSQNEHLKIRSLSRIEVLRQLELHGKGD
jgi:hypothetical protein